MSPDLKEDLLDMVHFLGIPVGIFLAVLLLGWILSTHPWSPTHHYTVGDCMVINLDQEAWQKDVIHKVVMVGKRAYLTRNVPDSGTMSQWVNGIPLPQLRDTPGYEISFITSELYKPVDCPLQGGRDAK